MNQGCASSLRSSDGSRISRIKADFHGVLGFLIDVFLLEGAWHLPARSQKRNSQPENPEKSVKIGFDP